MLSKVGVELPARNLASIAECKLFSPTLPAAVFPAIGDNHRDDLLRAVPLRREGLEYGAAASEHVAPLRIKPCAGAPGEIRTLTVLV